MKLGTHTKEEKTSALHQRKGYRSYQLSRMETFDRCLGPHGHEDGCKDWAMRQMDSRSSSSFVFGMQVETQSRVLVRENRLGIFRYEVNRIFHVYIT